MTKAIAILIDPQGGEHFHAYGPMTGRRDKATRFANASVAVKAALNMMGRGEQGFWNSEREHFAKAAKEYSQWSYRVEQVGEDDDDRSMWLHLARNNKLDDGGYERVYVKLDEGCPGWTTNKDEATEWATSLEARQFAAAHGLAAFDFRY